jgi:hypothetical protein
VLTHTVGGKLHVGDNGNASVLVMTNHLATEEPVDAVRVADGDEGTGHGSGMTYEAIAMSSGHQLCP